MYRKKIWNCGRSIDIMKYYPITCVLDGGKIRRKRRKREKPTKEAVKKYNQLMREREIIRICNANFENGNPYLTLKYSRENRPTVEEARKHKQKFLRGLRDLCRKEGIKFRYVYTTEIGERGGIHHHMLTNFENVKKIEEIWKRATKGTGNIHFEFTYGDDFSRLAVYFVGDRCTTLSDEAERSQEKRYSCSQGLYRPKATTETVKADSWREEPTAPKGYYVDKDSVYIGINPLTGYGYQFYRLIKIQDDKERRKRRCRTDMETRLRKKHKERSCCGVKPTKGNIQN